MPKTVIHISSGRWQNILSQSWRLGKVPDTANIISNINDDTEYHVLGDEEDFCRYCGTMHKSAEVNNPAELDEYKVRLRAAA